MPNPIYNNQHGSNRTQGAGADTKARGSKPSGAMPMKTANWPGVPGKTQSGDRSAGVKKTGHKGDFYVKKQGL